MVFCGGLVGALPMPLGRGFPVGAAGAGSGSRAGCCAGWASGCGAVASMAGFGGGACVSGVGVCGVPPVAGAIAGFPWVPCTVGGSAGVPPGCAMRVD
eukprot:14268958-Heterocapsa_arctica.AAC.1